MGKIRALLALDRHTLLLVPEAFFFLGKVRLELLRPFARLAATLGVKAEESPGGIEPGHARTLRAIASAIDIAGRHTPWDSQCLVRAVAGMRMLDRRQISSTLYLGTARDEEGKLIAHAWLRSGPLYISGADVMQRFVVVEKFTKNNGRARASDSLPPRSGNEMEALP